MAKEVELPKIKTISNRLIVDSNGNLWFATNEQKVENEKTLIAYDVFSKDGFYDFRIWSYIRPEIFIRNKMYSRHVDEDTGVTIIKRYIVKWNN